MSRPISHAWLRSATGSHSTWLLSSNLHYFLCMFLIMFLLDCLYPWNSPKWSEMEKILSVKDPFLIPIMLLFPLELGVSGGSKTPLGLSSTKALPSDGLCLYTNGRGAELWHSSWTQPYSSVKLKGMCWRKCFVFPSGKVCSISWQAGRACSQGDIKEPKKPIPCFGFHWVWKAGRGLSVLLLRGMTYP